MPGESAQAAEERRTNVMQAIATFVPRSEIEKDNRAILERIDDVAKVQGTEDGRIWAAVIRASGTLGVMILTRISTMH